MRGDPYKEKWRQHSYDTAERLIGIPSRTPPDEPTAGNHPEPNLSPIPLRHLLVPPAHDRTWLIHTPQGSPPAPTHISRPTGASYEDPEIAPSRPNIPLTPTRSGHRSPERRPPATV